MALFDKLFGNDEPTARSLTSVGELESGDFLKFGFNSLEGLSNQSLSVNRVTTHDLGGENKKKILFELQGSSLHLRLALIHERQGDRLEIARQVYPEDVENCFDVEAFINLLDPDTGVNHLLQRTGEPSELKGWLGTTYRQEAGHNAYLYPDDYRQQSMPADATQGSEHSYYLLVTDNRNHGLEVQVYDGGQTDVWLLAYVDPDMLEEMWPSAQGEH